MQVVATNYAKKKVLGRVSDQIHHNPSWETDPEIMAATQEASKHQHHSWWKRDKKFTPDMLLSKRDQKILHAVKTRAWYLDKGFNCCGVQVGLDGIVGLIPGIGDFIGTVLALQLIRTASRANLPKELLAKMMFNVLIDFMIGLTPIVGDILDILFKSNWRNAMLLEEYLIIRRRDEIRLEKGEAAAANAMMGQVEHDVIEGDGTTLNGLLTSSSSSSHQHHHPTSLKEPPPIKSATHQNNTVTPIITEVNEDNDKKKKYGTFFGRWK